MRVVTQKEYHHSRYSLILSLFFMFLLPLMAKKNMFIAKPFAES